MSLLDPLTWDWSTIIKAAVGAGIGSAGVQLFRDWRLRRAHAAYMAMRLAVTLEFYASTCSDFISANDNAETPPDEEFPNWDVTLPPLPVFPDDAEGWRSIDRRLAGRCLNLRNKIDGSQGLIRSTIEFSEERLGDVLKTKAAERGKEAWDLAVALRRKHHIEQADTVWDFADHLERSVQSGSRSVKERSSLKARFVATMTERPKTL